MSVSVTNDVLLDLSLLMFCSLCFYRCAACYVYIVVLLPLSLLLFSVSIDVLLSLSLSLCLY
jgi:hypothetical protein